MKWLALCFVAWQAARGVAEGITMYQPGPRAHPLFDWYHQIRLVEIVSLCAACWFLFDGHLTEWVFLAGLSIAAWEAFELAYLSARLGQAAGHENVMGLWSCDGPVWWLHIARVVVGLALMLGGRS